ncbi:hypothetical protein FHT87_005185 [Rhizobium sp. BK316]|uniref:hypothetical protein n=1 Tax=Rhizobium sp. BK316 TaxID=2587053 RepID=UPI001612AF22|nr:hypothetical protein [Rhizobium sp. BK316]MBB3411232.1 hypothetical protein [Rhizobium sp. BK316]
MKRRGFLGFIGGAAIAGPQAAKTAVKSLPSGMNVGGLMAVQPWGTPVSDASCIKGSGDWRLDEIARLKRLISGQLSDDEIEEKRQQKLHRLDPIVSQNVMALHSVAAHRKLAIYSERMTLIQEEINMLYHKRSLRDLLKAIGQ